MSGSIARCRVLHALSTTWSGLGNWGDGECRAELCSISGSAGIGIERPGTDLRRPIFGSRTRAIEQAGIEYRGWLPAHRAPAAFSPRRALPAARAARPPCPAAAGHLRRSGCSRRWPVAFLSSQHRGRMPRIWFPQDAYLRAENGAQMIPAHWRRLLTIPGSRPKSPKSVFRVIQSRHTLPPSRYAASRHCR